MRRFALFSALVVALFCLGCGGNTTDQSSPSPTVPAQPTPNTVRTHHPAAPRPTPAPRTPAPVVTQAPTTPNQSSESSSQTTFDDASIAQARCPSDTVVWVNSNSGIYHMPGERWYGRTENGFYMCQQDADAAGYRQTENGQ
jgi:hypothetical protein